MWFNLLHLYCETRMFDKISLLAARQSGSSKNSKERSSFRQSDSVTPGLTYELVQSVNVSVHARLWRK